MHEDMGGPGDVGMSTHVVLMAISVKAATRKEALTEVAGMMPRHFGEARNGVTLECWWQAEDDRIDGSDNDSAVFVHPGATERAFEALHLRGLTADCNRPAGAANGHFETREDDQALIYQAALARGGGSLGDEDWKDGLSATDCLRLYAVLGINPDDDPEEE
jgi:hypothetical protein